jgi:ketosteroid isomerase-like protein
MTIIEPQMDSGSTHQLQFIRAYLAAVEAGAPREALARFYTEDAEQIEFPNRLKPDGGRSGVPELLRRAERVPALLRRQHFEIHSMLAHGDVVAVEATWTGVLAVPMQALAAGDTMKAHFAIFFELRDGRIYRQRNYDCFEPW